MKYIVYYLEANLHLLDKASEKVSLMISEHISNNSGKGNNFNAPFLSSVW